MKILFTAYITTVTNPLMRSVSDQILIYTENLNNLRKRDEHKKELHYFSIYFYIIN
jgi:hypothetical protein